jgi:hypothetical protein
MGATNEAGKGFVDLGSMDHAQIVPQKTRGNVISGKAVAAIQTQGPNEATEQRPTGQAPQVLVHREGESIASIEFVCSCGQHAIVQIEYDDK